MKKMIFVSDIAGTLNSGFDNSDEHYEKQFDLLAGRLNGIKIKLGIDECIFSLCTYDTERDYLINRLKELQPHLEKYGITLGRQFKEREYLENGEWISDSESEKPNKIIKYARELESACDLKWIGYVDDKPSYDVFDSSINFFLNTTNLFHFFEIGAKYNDTGYKVTKSTTKALEGVIESLSFFINPNLINERDFQIKREEIKREELDKQERLEEEKRKEQKRLEEEKITQQKEEEKRRVEEKEIKDKKRFDRERLKEERAFLKKIKNNQYSDVAFKRLLDSNPDFQVILDYLENTYIENLPLKVLFSNDMIDAIADCSIGFDFPFLDKKMESRDYSYYQVSNILSSIDSDLFIRLISEDLVKDGNVVRNRFLYEGTFQNKKMKICNPTMIMYDKNYYNAIVFLMAQKKLTLYNLIDSVISFFGLSFETRNNDENIGILKDFEDITIKFPDLKINIKDINDSYVKALDRSSSELPF